MKFQLTNKRILVAILSDAAAVVFIWSLISLVVMAEFDFPKINDENLKIEICSYIEAACLVSFFIGIFTAIRPVARVYASIENSIQKFKDKFRVEYAEIEIEEKKEEKIKFPFPPGVIIYANGFIVINGELANFRIVGNEIEFTNSFDAKFEIDHAAMINRGHA